MYRKQNQMMEMFVCLMDAAVMLFSLFGAGMLRYQSVADLRRYENLAEQFCFMAVLHVAAFYVLKMYDGFFRRGRYRELFLVLQYHLILLAGATFLSFGLKRDIFVSRLVMGFFLVFNTILMWMAHLFLRNWALVFKGGTRKEENLLLVTTRTRLPKIAEQFRKSKEVSWNIVGAVLLDGVKGVNSDIPLVTGDEEEYLNFATRHVVDEVFIQVDAVQERAPFLKKMIFEFENMGVVVNLNLDLFDMGVSGEKRIYNLEEYHVVAFSSRLFDYRMVLAKRLLDIFGSVIGLVLTVPVGIVLAPFLLLESPGPLIFAQNRVGVNGRIFRFYKFRSMYMDAEARKKELMEQNKMQGLMFKVDHDPRITRVGAFIRKTSIDELPQFWNVLKGDMSLVGTRPPTLDEYQQYSYYQKRRISFRPGITGLWQISGRSDITDFDEVVRLDLEYIDNWSIMLDIKIIFKTIGVVLSGRGAE